MRYGDLFQELSGLSPNFYTSNYDEIMIPFSDKQTKSADFGGKAFTMRWQPFMYACVLGLINKRSIPFQNRPNDKNKLNEEISNYANGGFEIIRDMQDNGVSFGFSDFMTEISDRK